MVCKFCGAQIKDNAVYCPNCGKKQEVESAQNDGLGQNNTFVSDQYFKQPLTDNKKGNRIFTVLIVLVSVLLVGIIVLSLVLLLPLYNDDNKASAESLVYDTAKADYVIDSADISWDQKMALTAILSVNAYTNNGECIASGKADSFSKDKSLPIRKNADSHSEIIGDLSYDSEFSIYGASNTGWYFINYAGIVGYVDASRVSVKYTTGYVKFNKDKAVYFYAGPSEGTNKVMDESFNDGCALNVYATISNKLKSKHTTWYCVEMDGRVGYVSGDNFSFQQ